MKGLFIIILITGLLALLTIIVINFRVGSYSADRIYSDIESVPAEGRIAIVLGARVRNGEPSDMLYDRVMTGVELYKAGKTHRLLFSGGDDEPELMKKIAIENGVPDADIVLDDLGIRTLESCLRAKEVFEIANPILVTQDFHLPRSLYLCRNIGLDAIGVNAKRRDYQSEGFSRNREYLSNVRAWYDINF